MCNCSSPTLPKRLDLVHLVRQQGDTTADRSILIVEGAVHGDQPQVSSREGLVPPWWPWDAIHHVSDLQPFLDPLSTVRINQDGAISGTAIPQNHKTNLWLNGPKPTATGCRITSCKIAQPRSIWKLSIPPFKKSMITAL